MSKDEFLTALARTVACRECEWEELGLEELLKIVKAEVSCNGRYLRGLQSIGLHADPGAEQPRERLRQLRTSAALTLGVHESAFEGEG